MENIIITIMGWSHWGMGCLCNATRKAQNSCQFDINNNKKNILVTKVKGLSKKEILIIKIEKYLHQIRLDYT